MGGRQTGNTEKGLGSASSKIALSNAGKEKNLNQEEKGPGRKS